MITNILFFLISIPVAYFTESYSLSKVYDGQRYLQNLYQKNIDPYQWAPFLVGGLIPLIIFYLISKFSEKAKFTWFRYIVFFLIPYIIVTILVCWLTSYKYMVNY